MSQTIAQRCDIIIPVWNHLDETRECIESIKKHTIFPNRVVIVDNASAKPTKDYLDSLSGINDDKFVVLRNEVNEGFVKAINRGMRFSDAAYVCIMNNDTVATSGWLSEIIDIFRKNSKIGIVNPSSNTFGQFPGSLDIDSFARGLRPFKGSYQELYTCRAFSMVVKIEVIHRVGYLDETYEIGYFDDNDYSKRVQQAGYQTVRARASYVYHKESRSFSKLKEKSDIFKANEAKFESKWGRRLRVGYVLPAINTEEEAKRVSSNVNAIARMQHEIWIFSPKKAIEKCKFIDHDNIRFFYIARIVFNFLTFLKIWKRKKNKKIILILTNSKRTQVVFSFLKTLSGAQILLDKDISSVCGRLSQLSTIKGCSK
ncbi:MAG: glycosyltransferase family 2 protein [Candidatus Omnitrophica bacterium]|nr:glycosyltransferase family 2 protein [Candidatus Omnitrophota bacterium]